MDVLAHGLWTNVMFKAIPATRNSRKETMWGIAFGIIPDLMAFTPIFAVLFYNIILGEAQWTAGRPDFENMPLAALTHQLYNFSHSFVFWAVITLAAWAIFKRFPWILLGAFLHIAIDLFSHSREFFPTPFLYPISHYEIDGIPWSHPVFMVINYGLLLVMYLVVIPKLKKLRS
jgi:hypothetical protein